MRLATILPRASVEPVPVAAAPDGTWIELAGLIGRDAPRMRHALPWLMTHSGSLLTHAAAWKGPRYRESEFAFLPPVVRPPSFRGFRAFAPPPAGPALDPDGREFPIFSFLNHNALIGHDAEVWAPAGTRELDFALELGLVIGHGGHDIPPERAWEHVAGCTIINGLTARDLQRREEAAGAGGAKSRDFATAAGPWLVTRDALADCIQGERLSLLMSARRNGREISRGNTASLFHSLPRLIAEASRDAELFPGDLLATGAVGSGCLRDLGAEAGGWLQPGDVMELEIERLGLLRTRIVARPAH